MSRAWVLVVAAACYSPNAKTGAPCDPASPVCPGNQVCVGFGGGAYCEAPGFVPPIDAPPDIAIDANLDRDGDGVLNERGFVGGGHGCPFKR